MLSPDWPKLKLIAAFIAVAFVAGVIIRWWRTGAIYP